MGDKIYYVTGEGKKGAEMAPSMERLRQKGYEVLYMVDPLDEICSQTIGTFDGKQLVDINKAGLDFAESEEEKETRDKLAKEYEDVTTWLQEKLRARGVQSVQISERLVDSPAALVQAEWGLSPMMQRYMKAQTTAADDAFAVDARNQAILEINPEHAVIQRVKTAMVMSPDAPETEDLVATVYEVAALMGGYAIEDPGSFAKRVTKLLEKE